MRTVPGTHCVDVLKKAQDLLLRFGGHEMAAGLSLESSRISHFQARLAEIPILNTSQTDPIIFDAWIEQPPTLSETEKLYRAGPFGVGHPEPLFGLASIPKDRFERLGQTHIKFKWNAQCQIIGFGLAESLDQTEGTHVDILVTTEINRFRNSKSVQLRVCELRSSQSQDIARGPGRGLSDIRQTSPDQTGLFG
jgi:single-stranded-DNA-specific exonuclease